MIKNFLNPKDHQNLINGSKVTTILLKGQILPIGGASAVEGLWSTGLPHLVFVIVGKQLHIWNPIQILIWIYIYCFANDCKSSKSRKPNNLAFCGNQRVLVLTLTKWCKILSLKSKAIIIRSQYGHNIRQAWNIGVWNLALGDESSSIVLYGLVTLVTTLVTLVTT